MPGKLGPQLSRLLQGRRGIRRGGLIQEVGRRGRLLGGGPPGQCLALPPCTPAVLQGLAVALLDKPAGRQGRRFVVALNAITGYASRSLRSSLRMLFVCLPLALETLRFSVLR